MKFCIWNNFSHENGTVHIWRTDRVNFSPFLTYMTACEFDGFTENINNELSINDHRTTSFSESEVDDKNDEWPPFKKVI